MVAHALPVSGVRVHLREPTGDDQLVVLQPSPSAAHTVLALAERLARDSAGRRIDWPALPAVNLGAAALVIRGAWLGERIHTEAICPAPGCGEPIDVSFSVTDYFAHHLPRRFRGVVAGDDGWFATAWGEVSFRIPTIEDLVVSTGDGLNADWLVARCMRPSDAPPGARRRVERALSAIAPRLDDHVNGQCPVCGEVVELFFDPVSYVLAELRDASSDLSADVHELAFAYHWSERAILALDRRRRHDYVAMIRGELALA